MMNRLAKLLSLAAGLVAASNAFQVKGVREQYSLPPHIPSSSISVKSHQSTPLFAQSSGDEGNGRKMNPLEGLADMFANFDDVIDDFFYKRMGNGEQFYGKRKYNPSGKFEGDYNGMGRSDQSRIEMALVQKELMEERRLKRQAEEEARNK